MKCSIKKISEIYVLCTMNKTGRGIKKNDEKQ